MRFIRQTLSAEDVIRCCQEHNYYTCGSNQDFDKMLAMLDKKK